MTMTTDARAVESRETIADGFSVPAAGRHLHALPKEPTNCHWNVTGPMFPKLHLLFETQYNEFALAVDPVTPRSTRTTTGQTRVE